MRRVLQPVLAVLLGLGAGLVVTWLAGENPWHVLKILFNGAFGTRYDFGLTLFYTTPLIFTGLSVAVAFHAGLFNIGAEGQLTVGALAAAVTGAAFPSVWWPVAPLFACVAAMAAGSALASTGVTPTSATASLTVIALVTRAARINLPADAEN